MVSGRDHHPRNSFIAHPALRGKRAARIFIFSNFPG
jgi:hypothetical protein